MTSKSIKSNLYYRKVQVVGKSSLIISLPKEWTKLVGITPGTTLTLRIDPTGSLVIEAPGKREKQRRTLKIELKPDDMGRTIRESVSAYIAGYNEIEILFKERYRDLAQEVRRILEEIMLGLSLIEETPTSLKFYTVVDPRSMRFNEVLTRACRVASSMLRDIYGACEKNDDEALKSVIERDQLVDKLYILALRQLTGALLGEFRLSELELRTIAETLHIFIAIKSIERIADHATIIASEVLRIGAKVCNKVTWLYSVLSQLEELLNNACKILVNLSKDRAHDIAKRSSDLRLKIRENREKEALKGNIAILRVIDSFDRIAGYLMDIAEATIDIETIRSITEDRY